MNFTSQFITGCLTPNVSLDTCTRVQQLRPEEPVSVSLGRGVGLVWTVVTGLRLGAGLLVTGHRLCSLRCDTGRGLALSLRGGDLPLGGGLGLVTAVSCPTIRVRGGGSGTEMSKLSITHIHKTIRLPLCL